MLSRSEDVIWNNSQQLPNVENFSLYSASKLFLLYLFMLEPYNNKIFLAINHTTKLTQSG